MHPGILPTTPRSANRNDDEVWSAGLKYRNLLPAQRAIFIHLVAPVTATSKPEPSSVSTKRRPVSGRTEKVPSNSRPRSYQQVACISSVEFYSSSVISISGR